MKAIMIDPKEYVDARVEDMYRLISGEINSVNKKIDSLETSLDGQMHGLRDQYHALENRMIGVENRMIAVETKMDVVLEAVKMIGRSMRSMQKQYDDMFGYLKAHIQKDPKN